ncbi:MAG TPA: MATE family efflux transporter [Clostridia bacterium]|nr:MATE family efflux transporter [Clostridia bacterium]
MVREKAFYRNLVTLAVPSAIQGFMSLLVVQADNMMVSSLGETVLAGVGQSNSATAFFTAMVMGMTSGSAVLISQYWGKNDQARIRRIFAIVSQICVTLALLAVLLIRLWPRAVLGVFTNEQSVIEAALPYFTLVCFSYLPFSLTTALVGMLRSVEVVRVTLYITVISLFTNISLNYVFIFGKLGFPAMGVRGAALATILARSVELGVVCWYAFCKQKHLALRPKDLLRGDGQLLLDYVRYGLPVGLGDTQWALVGVCKAAIVGRLGETMIAANLIAESMMSLGMIFTSSLAAGACILIGKTVGVRDYVRTRAYSNTIQLLFLCVGVTMSALVFFLRVPYGMLYGNVGPDVRALSAQLIAWGALTMIGTTYHASCFVGINRGAGDSRFVFVVDLICGWLIVLPLSLLAAFVWHFPLPLIFLCLRIDQCFKWIIAFFRLRGNKWIRNVTREDAPALEG